MSGGSLDYVFERVDAAASTVRKFSQAPVHLAFANHLELVAKALKGLEWAFSGDGSHEDATIAILNVLSPDDVMAEVVEQAERAAADLVEVLRVVRTPEEAERGEPVAWRWKNRLGATVTNWIDYKPALDAGVREMVAAVNGAMEYAYAAPQLQFDIAKAIHYPECWDTTAYPTVEAALHELSHWFRCSTCKGDSQ